MLENLFDPKEIPRLIDFVMPVIFVGFAVLFSIVAVILSYHWRRYGVAKVRATILMTIYLIGGLVLLVAMATARISY